MNNKFSEPSKQISEIRDLMLKSSKFISLSGLSGVSAGVIAILGVLAAIMILGYRIPGFTEPYAVIPAGLKEILIIIITDALLVAMLAISTAVFFTARKASYRGVKAWDSTSKRLIINMLIPLSAGGVFSIALLYYGLAFIVPPATLIFYGISLVNAGKYTFDEIRILGILEMLLGITSLFIPEHNVLFWAVGFGLLHIIYGSWMFVKYEYNYR